MSKITLQSQDVVAETLLIALYARALEAQCPAPLVKDDKAVALVRQIDYDFSRFKLKGHDQATTIMRLREFDRRTQDFLARTPEAVVVHIGCGLDTRFERVDNGRVEWYDLDLPEVIDLRHKLMNETARLPFPRLFCIRQILAEYGEHPCQSPISIPGRRSFSILCRSAGKEFGASAKGAISWSGAGLRRNDTVHDPVAQLKVDLFQD